MSGIRKSFVLRNQTNAAALHAFLKANAKACSEAGHPLHVEVCDAGLKRSLAQNRRNWSMITFIAENAWVKGKQFSKEAWHEFFAEKFGSVREIEMPNGKKHLVRESTTEMDVETFSNYMQEIEAYAASELGLEFSC